MRRTSLNGVSAYPSVQRLGHERGPSEQLTNAAVSSYVGLRSTVPSKLSFVLMALLAPTAEEDATVRQALLRHGPFSAQIPSMNVYNYR